MEVLYEMLACFHHSMTSFHLPEEISVFSHRREDLIERRFIVAREKTPRVTKTRSPDHKTVEIFETSWMHHLRDPILI
jgi:hypothetical protein